MSKEEIHKVQTDQIQTDQVPTDHVPSDQVSPREILSSDESEYLEVPSWNYAVCERSH